METSNKRVWSGVLEAMKLSLSEGSFNTYLKPTDMTEVVPVGDRLLVTIVCPSMFIKNTVEQRYRGQISAEISRLVNKECELVFKIEGKKQEVVAEKEALPLFVAKNKSSETVKRSNLREDYTFENYAVSGSNQMAFAAAQAVARQPGTTYNPLFIYGGVGVGKTHLMQAIGHAVLEKFDSKVLFCSGEEFTNDLVEAIRFKNTDKVRSKYRKVKLLMIDDVQFIAGKPSVQEEFFHTFNDIQREGGQVVMTSDKPPTDIIKLEERLRSRFGAGLIVDIGPADFELRTAILLIKAKQRQIELPMDAAQSIATNIDGVRELQGFLMKIVTEAEIRKAPISKELVESVLKIANTSKETSRIITPSEVFSIVGGFYGVGAQQLKGERRTKSIVWPRQVLMYFLRHELRLPLEEVGRLLGGRDHTTIMHGSDKVKTAIEINQSTRAELAEIKRKIVNNL